MRRRSFLFLSILLSLLLTGCSYDLLSSLFNFTSAVKENVITPGNLESLVEEVESGVDSITSLGSPVFSGVTIDLSEFAFTPVTAALDSKLLFTIASASENSTKKNAIRDALSQKADAEQIKLCKATSDFMQHIFSELLEEVDGREGVRAELVKKSLENFLKEDVPADYIYTKRDVLAFSLEVYLIDSFLSYYPMASEDKPSKVTISNLITTLMTASDFSDTAFKSWIDRAVAALASVKNVLTVIGDGSVDTMKLRDVNAILESLLEVE